MPDRDGNALGRGVNFPHLPMPSMLIVNKKATVWGVRCFIMGNGGAYGV